MDKEDNVEKHSHMDRSRDKKTYMFDERFIQSVLDMDTHSNCDSTVNHIVNLEEGNNSRDYSKNWKILQESY